MKDVLPAIDDNRMARIVPPLIPRDYIEALGQQVNNFTFAFVAPLSADNYQICHVNRFRASSLGICRQRIFALPNIIGMRVKLESTFQ
jgi:hypothetical protein